MAYLPDSDISFLQNATNEELGILFNLLTCDKDGGKRITQFLSVCNEHKLHGDDYKKYWERIVEALQYYGGNSVANTTRGHGAPYKDILKDIMSKLNVKIDERSNIEDQEALLIKTFGDRGELFRLIDGKLVIDLNELYIRVSSKAPGLLLDAIFPGKKIWDDLAGHNYKVTIPCVLYIAYLRKTMNVEK